MHYNFIDEKTSELKHTVPALLYAEQMVLSRTPPFKKPSFLTQVKIRFIRFCFSLLAKVFKNELLVQNNYRELFYVDSRIRTALSRLVQEGIVVKWERRPTIPGAPAIIYYAIEFIARPPGGLPSISTQGLGTGRSLTEAIVPAFAEGLERLSSFTWDTSKVVRGSYNDLKSQGAIDPLLFDTFSNAQRQLPYFKNKTTPRHDLPMTWVKADDFQTGARCLVPAQTAFIGYYRGTPNDPYFGDTSSNGVAAGSSIETTLYGAICEAIERDAFMIYWLNKLSPKRIDPMSIPSEEVHVYTEQLRRYRYTIHILDLTSDIQLPTYCALLIDEFGTCAFSVSSAADFDHIRAFEKIFKEIIKFTNHRLGQEIVNSPLVNNPPETLDIRSIRERQIVWSQKRMLPYASFLWAGEQVPFDTEKLNNPLVIATTQERLRKLQSILLNKGYEAYIIDITSKEAAAAGLHVLRALIPKLVPVYFQEEEKPLGVDRLYQAPILLNIKNHPSVEGNVYSIPHPYL